MAPPFKACSVDGCNRSIAIKIVGLCNIHYQRWRRHGDPAGGGKFFAKKIARGGPCLIDGCEGKGEQKGYCQAHYNRLKRHGDPTAGRPLRHGQYGTRLHRIWRGMRSRCGHTACCNENDIRNYRDRGIVVCSEWQDFSPFAEWSMANGYADDLTIDRIDNDRGYEPDNCQWVTILVNIRTRASNKLDAASAAEIRRLWAKGISGTTLAKRFGVHREHIYSVCKGRSWT